MIISGCSYSWNAQILNFTSYILLPFALCMHAVGTGFKFKKAHCIHRIFFSFAPSLRKSWIPAPLALMILYNFLSFSTLAPYRTFQCLFRFFHFYPFLLSDLVPHYANINAISSSIITSFQLLTIRPISSTYPMFLVQAPVPLSPAGL